VIKLAFTTILLLISLKVRVYQSLAFKNCSYCTCQLRIW